MTARVLVTKLNLRLQFWFLGGRLRLGIIKYEERVTLWHYVDRRLPAFIDSWEIYAECKWHSEVW